MPLKNQKTHEDKKNKTEIGTFFVRIKMRDWLGIAYQEKVLIV